MKDSPRPIRPRALRPGSVIGIAAPSSPIEEAALQAGSALLEARGYRVFVGDHVRDTAAHCGYLAGHDRDRASDLNTLFARPDIDAILCARGGYGAMRLLPYLDWPAIRANPKIFIGYSDITSLHLALSRRCGLITFHGPMLGSLAKCSEVAREVFWRMLENPAPLGEYEIAADTMQTVAGGTAEGELAGGCLSLLAAACGSEFAPDFTRKIVLIEEVGEAVYRADRCLTQLRNAGLFDAAAGFVIGSLTGWPEDEPFPEVNSPDALWQNDIAPLGLPALSGFPFGHEPNPMMLPLGVRARLDASARTLTLLEPAVTLE